MAHDRRGGDRRAGGPATAHADRLPRDRFGRNAAAGTGLASRTRWRPACSTSSTARWRQRPCSCWPTGSPLRAEQRATPCAPPASTRLGSPGRVVPRLRGGGGRRAPAGRFHGQGAAAAVCRAYGLGRLGRTGGAGQQPVGDGGLIAQRLGAVLEPGAGRGRTGIGAPNRTRSRRTPATIGRWAYCCWPCWLAAWRRDRCHATPSPPRRNCSNAGPIFAPCWGPSPSPPRSTCGARCANVRHAASRTAKPRERNAGHEAIGSPHRCSAPCCFSSGHC